MALLPSEIQRIRFELGFPNLDTAADVYVPGGIYAYFTAVLQPYLLGGAVTTSSTPVVAADVPTPQTITLASATGFTAGDVVVIDVDARQERATIQNLSGSALTAQLSLAHSGSYPIVVEGGESLIRDVLREIRLLTSGMNGTASAMSAFRSRVGLKKVDDVEFFGGGATLASQGVDPLTQLNQLREFWRDELATALGIPRLNGPFSNGGSEVSMY